MEVQTLVARRHLARKEFAEARSVIEQAIAMNEKAIWPRVVLTHILLQEGKDWSRAEKALRDVLALDPNHSEARRNLETLRHQIKMRD
jgi:tetratricopeptide (TPR) repeat protein